MNKKTNIAVFVSGSGSNLEAIAANCFSGNINGKIILVVCNNSKAYAIERAKKFNLETIVIENTIFMTKEEHEQRIIQEVDKYNIDLIALAGYMRLLSKEFIDHYNNVKEDKYRIMNIHPALLPSFPGGAGYEDAFSHRIRISGITVHFVDYGEDTGPIILQKEFPIYENDEIQDIKKRGLAIEHRLYPKAIQLFAEDRLRIETRTYQGRERKIVKIID